MKLCMSITQLLDMSASDPATAHSRESALLHVLRKHDISFARAGEEFRLNFGNPQSYIVTQVFQMLQHDGGTIFDLPTSAITEYLDGLFSYVYEGNTERVMYLRRCSEICNLFGEQFGAEMLMVHWSTHFSLEHYYNHYEYTRLSSELTVEEISIYYTFEFLRDVCLLENNDPEAQFEYRTLYDIFDPDRKIRTA